MSTLSLRLCVVLGTNANVSHYVLLSNGVSGLVQILETEASSLTFSPATSFALSLDNSIEYTLGFIDPTFAVISGNPETVPRTFVSIPSNAGNVFIYLKVCRYQSIHDPISFCISSIERRKREGDSLRSYSHICPFKKRYQKQLFLLTDYFSWCSTPT